MNKERFIEIMQTVCAMGYFDEIKWQRELQPCSDADTFFSETCWVILNSGMKEQIARKIWQRIQAVWYQGGNTIDAFKHAGKVKAIDFVASNHNKLFAEYNNAEDKITFLQTIPFIGKITCWHLAKNLGHDCVKPDRHLVRIATQYNTTPDELCAELSKQTGEKKSVVDIVLWRACNLKII